MEFIEGGSYVLIRIKTPQSHSFYDEHISLIKKYGHVWFCRFGKNNMKIDSVKSCEPILLIKESGNNEVFFAAEYSQIKESLSSSDAPMPNYYNDIEQEASMWFNVSHLKTISHAEVTRDFRIRTSGGNVETILHSMCPATFLKYSKQTGGI